MKNSLARSLVSTMILSVAFQCSLCTIQVYRIPEADAQYARQMRQARVCLNPSTQDARFKASAFWTKYIGGLIDLQGPQALKMTMNGPIVRRLVSLDIVFDGRRYVIYI